jgi:hypothetical protein
MENITRDIIADLPLYAPLWRGLMQIGLILHRRRT